MSDEIREQLSALADDELDDVERPLLLGRLERDAELRECLGRYKLISEVMRGVGHMGTLDVADRVRDALELDGQVPAADKLNRRTMNWWKPLAGFAVAASVAMVAVLTVTSIREPSTETTPLVAETGGASPAGRVSDERWNRIEPQIDKRLSGYLVNHSEYAASRGVQAVMPYVRIVGYDNGRQ